MIMTRCQAPEVFAISLIHTGIFDAISLVDARKRPVVLKVISEPVLFVAGIESQEGIMGKEERAARADPDRQRDAIVSVAVPVMVSVCGLAPGLAVASRGFRR